MDRQDSSVARDVHVGREPVYDRDGALVGYELLFRGPTEAASPAAYATSRVLIDACTEFGLDHLVNGRLAFINLTREFLTGELPLPFDPDRVVLQVRETVPDDDAVAAGVRQLAAAGYAIALDDFVVDGPAERLLDIAAYVKIDTLDLAPSDLAQIVQRCRRAGRPQLVAKRMPTHQDLTVARDAGFDLFQGNALRSPEVVSAARLNPSRLHILRLLALLNDQNTDMADIAELCTHDAALCTRLLTAANSAANAAGHRITSVQQAAMLIGTRQLQAWLTLMAVTDITGDEQQTADVLINARFCHQIAQHAELASDAAFTAGLLDALCAAIDEPRTDLVPRLPLTDDLAAALIGGHGPLGEILATARAYRQGHSRPTGRTATANLTYTYLAAIRWTHDLTFAAAA